MPHATIDPALALPHLSAADPVMDRIIRGVGAFGLQADASDPFRALSRSIVFQQLSGTAAGTIFSRFVGLFDADGGATREVRRSDPSWTPQTGAFPRPEEVLAATDEALRGAGLSRQKVAALRSLSEHFASGELGSAVFAGLEDEELIRRVTAVRGIGRWTAEMFLMFHLGRPDVLPVNDVGINRAIQKQYGVEGPLKPADVLRIGEPWRPWATVACWYLWRSEDVVVPG